MCHLLPESTHHVLWICFLLCLATVLSVYLCVYAVLTFNLQSCCLHVCNIMHGKVMYITLKESLQIGCVTGYQVIRVIRIFAKTYPFE